MTPPPAPLRARDARRAVGTSRCRAGIPERVGDRRQGHAVDVVGDQQRSLVLGQPLERLGHRVGVGDADGSPAARRSAAAARRAASLIVGELDLAHAPGAATQDRPGAVDDDPVEPGVEQRRIAQPRQVAPGLTQASWVASAASASFLRIDQAMPIAAIEAGRR